MNLQCDVHGCRRGRRVFCLCEVSVHQGGGERLLTANITHKKNAREWVFSTQ